jgi:hypothetical protein
MARYKLENVLWSTRVEEHDSDEAAWNSLRKIFKTARFTWMWKEIEIVVPINNEEHYVEEWNSIYGPRPIGYGPDDVELMEVGKINKETLWVPILRGLTSDEYNATNTVTYEINLNDVTKK